MQLLKANSNLLIYQIPTFTTGKHHQHKKMHCPAVINHFHTTVPHIVYLHAIMKGRRERNIGQVVVSSSLDFILLLIDDFGRRCLRRNEEKLWSSLSVAQ